MKKILLLISIFTLFNNLAYTKEPPCWETFENLNQYAASPEDKVLITSFANTIEEKYKETNFYPQIVGSGIPANFILFRDGEIVIVLNMKNISMGNNTKDDVSNFVKTLTKKVGRKNLRYYYLNNEDEPNKNNIYVRVRLK